MNYILTRQAEEDLIQIYLYGQVAFGQSIQSYNEGKITKLTDDQLKEILAYDI